MDVVYMNISLTYITVWLVTMVSFGILCFSKYIQKKNNVIDELDSKHINNKAEEQIKKINNVKELLVIKRFLNTEIIWLFLLLIIYGLAVFGLLKFLILTFFGDASQYYEIKEFWELAQKSLNVILLIILFKKPLEYLFKFLVSILNDSLENREITAPFFYIDKCLSLKEIIISKLQDLNEENHAKYIIEKYKYKYEKNKDLNKFINLQFGVFIKETSIMYLKNQYNGQDNYKELPLNQIKNLKEHFKLKIDGKEKIINEEDINSIKENKEKNINYKLEYIDNSRNIVMTVFDFENNEKLKNNLTLIYQIILNIDNNRKKIMKR